MEACPQCHTIFDSYLFVDNIRIRRSNNVPTVMKEHLVALCTTCAQQYFTIRKIGEIGKWQQTAINISDLVEQLTEKEFDEIEDALEENDDLESSVDWSIFLISLKSSDEIWRYECKTNLQNEKGIAIKRGNFIIANSPL